MESYYVIDKASNGQWYWVLKAPNHETIVVSETYVARASAEKGILLNRAYASTTKVVDRTAQSSGYGALGGLRTLR